LDVYRRLVAKFVNNRKVFRNVNNDNDSDDSDDDEQENNRNMLRNNNNNNDDDEKRKVLFWSIEALKSIENVDVNVDVDVDVIEQVDSTSTTIETMSQSLSNIGYNNNNNIVRRRSPLFEKRHSIAIDFISNDFDQTIQSSLIRHRSSYNDNKFKSYSRSKTPTGRRPHPRRTTNNSSTIQQQFQTTAVFWEMIGDLSIVLGVVALLLVIINILF
jgi:hypothetical protein